MKTVLYGTIIDATGKKPIENGMIVVDGNTIEYVGKKDETYQIPKDATVLNFSEKWLMPGMVEAHSHLAGYRSGNTLDWIITPQTIKVCQAVKDLKALLNAGYTSVRDMGGYGCELKRAMEQGIIEGPRIILTFGPILLQNLLKKMIHHTCWRTVKTNVEKWLELNSVKVQILLRL